MSETFMTMRIDDHTKQRLRELAKAHDRKLVDEIRHALKKYILETVIKEE